MNLVQFKRHDGDGDVFINPAHVAMVEPSTVGDDNVTDIVVAAQAGLALVRVREPIKDVVDMGGCCESERSVAALSRLRRTLRRGSCSQLQAAAARTSGCASKGDVHEVRPDAANDAVQCFQVFAPKIDHRAGAPSPEKTTETDSRHRTLGEAVFTRKNAGLDPLP